jgi:peptidoglycan/LPS O-acetylase OafA/YrhL
MTAELFQPVRPPRDLQTHPKYRGDVDGLRAVAVSSVVVYHAFPDLLRGGFVGVDVFFVISGFLISSIILNELHQGVFRFGDFFARRIKRIFPALILVLTFSLMIGWFILLPEEYASLGKHTAAGAGFIANILLWSESGYFDTSSDFKPLLHLWSLGVEEQFYIVWPVMLYLGSKRHVNALLLMAAILLASFVLNLRLASSSEVAAFYSPVTRFWELLLGGILAYHRLVRKRSSNETNSQLSSGASVVGILLISAAVLFLDEDMQFPGWWALIPVTGSLLIIHAGPHALINRTILSQRPIVLVGLISYPLYLWHWPLLSYARIVNSGPPPATVRIFLVVLSASLAYLTYQFLEKPIRLSTLRNGTVLVLSANMAVLALAGFSCFEMNGIPSRFSAQFQSYVTYKYDPASDARAGSCWLDASDAPDGYASDCVDQSRDGKPLIVVWGDSHAARFYVGLRALEGTDYRLAQFTRDSCPPVLDFAGRICSEANTHIITQIELLKPSAVILFAAWNRYQSRDNDDAIFKQIGLTIQELKEMQNLKIIFMGPAPQWTDALPNVLVREARTTIAGAIKTRTLAKFDSKVAKFDSMLREQLQTLGEATYFSPLDAMCDKSGCLATVNGQADGLTTWDYGHLTAPGAVYLARKLAESILGLADTR